LIGALILTLTLVPVLASFTLKGIKDKRNPVFEWVRKIYGKLLAGCLRFPALTLIGATLIFGASLLLIPDIGVEFLPHLDEGALWVRATMPYSISFEESAKFAPKIRDLLMQYPQVTTVASELGRP